MHGITYATFKILRVHRTKMRNEVPYQRRWCPGLHYTLWKRVQTVAELQATVGKVWGISIFHALSLSNFLLFALFSPAPTFSLCFFTSCPLATSSRQLSIQIHPSTDTSPWKTRIEDTATLISLQWLCVNVFCIQSPASFYSPIFIPF